MDRVPGGGSAGAVSSRYHRLAPASSVAGWLVPPLPFFFRRAARKVGLLRPICTTDGQTREEQKATQQTAHGEKREMSSKNVMH